MYPRSPAPLLNHHSSPVSLRTHGRHTGSMHKMARSGGGGGGGAPVGTLGRCTVRGLLVDAACCTWYHRGLPRRPRRGGAAVGGWGCVRHIAPHEMMPPLSSSSSPLQHSLRQNTKRHPWRGRERGGSLDSRTDISGTCVQTCARTCVQTCARAQRRRAQGQGGDAGGFRVSGFGFRVSRLGFRGGRPG